MAYNFPDAPTVGQVFSRYAWDGEKWILAAGGVAVPPSVSPGDSYWANVVLLMGFEGAHDATSGPGMVDESSAAHGAGTTNINSKISTAQFAFGGSSLSVGITGTGNVRFADHADWDFSNQPFTIEFRMRPNNITQFGFIVCQWEAPISWVIYQDSAMLKFNCSTDGTNNFNDIVSGNVLTANTWHAVCLDFNGTKYRLYVNGAMVASSTTVRTIYNSTVEFSIGATQFGSFPYVGYLDEFRITKGVARYASDSGYTIATAAFPRAGTYATFDGTPSSGVVMSNGNLTVTHGSTTADTGVTSTAFKTTGKWYFEITLVGSASIANYIGIILSSGVYSDMPMGINYSGVALHTAFGTYVYSNDSVGVNFSTPSSVVGTVWGFAVDLTARQFWARVNGGNWNNSGSASPVTPAGGFTIKAGSFAPFVRFAAVPATDAFTANFGASAFAYAVPSGFTSGWTP